MGLKQRFQRLNKGLHSRACVNAENRFKRRLAVLTTNGKSLGTVLTAAMFIGSSCALIGLHIDGLIMSIAVPSN